MPSTENQQLSETQYNEKAAIEAPVGAERKGNVDELIEKLNDDPRFNPSTPSRWKRAALLLLIFALCWLALSIRAHNRKPKIIYAERYSEEFKYRPAASPIITERLKDGRTRLRGALPTGM
ncbi:hypothetical protein WOLCODRAFT_163881 [Wolfiporia cocos MD-104 SS10]|uniref:Uncharacterized protein n=1 Tax=Wolfiporia cocos (strain MD-104) TaxID=742152 RepID=A0A2H3JL02_WOLCO|nr:hypothetical protein WOLCODRAFT_163881 [Wolfiporia cocos MD-104 SS10]